MKKSSCLILAGVLTFLLVACHRGPNAESPSDVTDTNTHIASDDTTESKPDVTNATLNVSPSDATEGTEPKSEEITQRLPDNTTENPYAIREITDGTVTVVGDKKVFNNTQLTLSVPASWKCLTASGEDNVAYYFQDAMMGEKCQLYIDVTFTYYYKERTRDEYLESLSRSYENVVLDSFTTENIHGFPCAKAVFSYTKDNTTFVGIRYVNLIEGPRLYYFRITYPAAERNTYETVFESIIDSIQFMQTK